MIHLFFVWLDYALFFAICYLFVSGDGRSWDEFDYVGSFVCAFFFAFLVWGGKDHFHKLCAILNILVLWPVLGILLTFQFCHWGPQARLLLQIVSSWDNRIRYVWYSIIFMLFKWDLVWYLIWGGDIVFNWMGVCLFWVIAGFDGWVTLVVALWFFLNIPHAWFCETILFVWTFFRVCELLWVVHHLVVQIGGLFVFLAMPMLVHQLLLLLTYFPCFRIANITEGYHRVQRQPLVRIFFRKV